MNLLEQDLFKRYSFAPQQFRADVEAQLREGKVLTVFVDEVQKVPALLDEVHLLIEKHKNNVRFILTSSSARKLRRGGANLLAGRAWTLHLHPLCHREITADLPRALQFGTLPAVYLDDPAPVQTLKSYVETYLKEEIFQEALVRRLDAFMQFVELAGQVNGEPVNFSKIARAARITPVTCQDFFEILVDTLVVTKVPGWTYSVRKQIQKAPKYYWFDCGVLNALQGTLNAELQESSFRFGKLFETWIVQEIIRLNDYSNVGYRLYYWRTQTGQEVDLILSTGPSAIPIAVEIKSETQPSNSDVRPLRGFKEEHPNARLLCLCRTPRRYGLGGLPNGAPDVEVFPWQEGLQELFLIVK